VIRCGQARQGLRDLCGAQRKKRALLHHDALPVAAQQESRERVERGR
jgi:hypothetical protein